MNKQLLSRIDSFIDSLGQQNMSDQQEAVLLTADIHNIGGKNDKCTNYTEKACTGTGENKNDGCTNYDVCTSGDNSGCSNRAKPNSKCYEPAIG
jgi:hypothetical protein